MSEELGQAIAGEKEAAEIQSPADKLEDKQLDGTSLPGVERPDGKEVKEEKSPNTE